MSEPRIGFGGKKRKKDHNGWAEREYVRRRRRKGKEKDSTIEV